MVREPDGSTDERRATRVPPGRRYSGYMGILARIFGGVALLLLTLVGIGFLLPANWTAEATTTVGVGADSAYSAISRVGSWPAWMPWPESGARFSGPAAGPGASFQWDDPVYGSGSFEIRQATAGQRIAYRVSIEDGAIVVDGRIELEEAGGETRVRWTEEGDAGRNPLVGFAVLTQPERQSDQLAEALQRLRSHLEGSL